MQVLVTGSSGVLGQSLVPQLIERGDDLRLFDMVAPTAQLESQLSAADRIRVERIQGDMRDPSALERASDGATRVRRAATVAPRAP